MRKRVWHRLVGAGLVFSLALAIGAAEARPFGNFGSRGSRTYASPPVTNTAPRPAAPIERSMTQPGQPGYQRPAPAAVPPTAQRPRFGFGSGLAAGLLGAGLLGMLTGHGFFGGLGGIGSFLGLLLQIGLIVFLASLAVKWFRRRNQPAYAGAPTSSPNSRSMLDHLGLGGLGRGGLGLGGLGRGPSSPRSEGGAASRAPSRDDVGIGAADYQAFERLLGEVQVAYGRGDLAALRLVTTPEMVSYLAEELAENARKGVVNAVTEPRLIQGDLAEAWREPDGDYATVAMRYAIVDVTRERESGRVVAGDPTRAEEVTEVWTFRRPPGTDWKLSAIQQV